MFNSAYTYMHIYAQAYVSCLLICICRCVCAYVSLYALSCNTFVYTEGIYVATLRQRHQRFQYIYIYICIYTCNHGVLIEAFRLVGVPSPTQESRPSVPSRVQYRGAAVAGTTIKPSHQRRAKVARNRAQPTQSTAQRGVGTLRNAAAPW